MYIRFIAFWNFAKLQFFLLFWLLRYFYSGDAHRANYGECCSNHHFRHCSHCVKHPYSVLKLSEIAVCFAHFGFYGISTPVMRTMQNMVNGVQIIISDMAHTLYITFKAFWNFSKLLFVFHNLVFTKFLESFRHCAHFVYHIWSVLKLFKMAVFFAQFGFYEISTPVMRTVLTIVTVVQIIISDIAHSLYIRFTAFLKFSKLLFVLHNLAFTKFLETSAIAHTVYITFTVFWNFSKLLLILHNLGLMKFLLQWCAPC